VIPAPYEYSAAARTLVLAAIHSLTSCEVTCRCRLILVDFLILLLFVAILVVHVGNIVLGGKAAASLKPHCQL